MRHAQVCPQVLSAYTVAPSEPYSASQGTSKPRPYGRGVARLFLENGNRVFGVEPNPEMRRTGERLLRRYGRFTSVAARAEDTTLPDGSVDLVSAGQAFHWFDPVPTRREFARILKPGGYVALIWNTRRKEGEPFLGGYEELLRTHGTDYREVYHGRRGSPESIRGFFRHDPVEEATFENRQPFDFEGLSGRLLSSSYVPDEGEPGHPGLMEAARRLFEEHQTGGSDVLEYDTQVLRPALRRAGALPVRRMIVVRTPRLARYDREVHTITATKRRKKAIAARKIPPTTSRALGLNLNIEPRATFASSGHVGS
jgi:SAM-dependent methyltransferase